MSKNRVLSDTTLGQRVKTAGPEGAIRVKKSLVLACGALVYDLVNLLGIKDGSPEDQNNLASTLDLQCLPAHLHNTPQFIALEVDKYLAQHAASYESIFVAYADCGSAGELDKVLDKYGAERLPGAHCYEFFAGSEQFADLMDQELGSFFLTDYLVKFFDRLIMQGLGLEQSPELRDVYFKHYTRLVYLAQTKDDALRAQAEDSARKLGLEFHHRYVGTEGLAPVVEFGQRSFLNIPVVVQ